MTGAMLRSIRKAYRLDVAQIANAAGLARVSQGAAGAAGRAQAGHPSGAKARPERRAEAVAGCGAGRA